jgi:hypothetical protein
MDAAPVVASIGSAPRATLATFGRLRAMLAASTVATGLFSFACWLALYNVIKEARNPAVDGTLEVMLAVVGGLTAVKTAIELSALMRLRGVPNVPLSAMPGLEPFARIAKVWLTAFWIAFVVLALHVVYGVAMLVEFVVGFVFALIATIVTLGTSAKRAFSLWWDAFLAMEEPPRWEGRVLDAIFAHREAKIVFWAVMALLFVGPTICAVYVHAKRAAFRPSSNVTAWR